MEVMFYIIAGKFNPSNDDFPVKTLITKDKFADKYAQDCANLLDQQDIFKIIDKIVSAITNGIECVTPRKDVGFNGFVVEDVIDTGKRTSFAEIANVYDGGKIKFLQNWADAIDDIETSIYRVNVYLENKVMCDVAEGLMVRLARAGYVPENHVFIALDANGNVSCVQPLEFIIDVHCTSESDKEFTRGYVREALIKLISEAVASSVLDGVEIGDVSELNVTIVNK